MLRWDVRNLSTHKHEMAWERMVAQAAPATPILKTKMNIGSRIILITRADNDSNHTGFCKALGGNKVV